MYQHCLPWGRLTEHAQSEHRQNVCMRKRESEWERGRERGAGGGRNQLFSIIKNATSKVELPQLSTSVWRMKSGLEPWGMLACMTFINLITEILIWGRERGGGGLRLHHFLLSGRGLWKRSSMQDRNSVRMWPTSPVPQAHGWRHPVWRLNEGHLVTADAHRPTAGFH